MIVLIYLLLLYLTRLATASNEDSHFEDLHYSDECPCINPWANNDANLSSVGSITTCSQCGELSRCLTKFEQTADGEMEQHSCVPLDYGASRCEYWDIDSGYIGSDQGESYAWCFVDPNECYRPHQKVLWNGQEMYQSYETCGYVDYSHMLHNIVGAHMRVSFPGDGSDGYTLVTTTDEYGDKRRSGSVHEFIMGILDDLKGTYNVSWEEVPVSDKSSTRYSSSYTACVHEISLNETDLCIGAFWTTSERLLLAPFTSMLYVDSFYMVTEASSSSFAEKLLTPFAPFTKDAWQYISFVVLYMALAIGLIQRRLGIDSNSGGGLARKEDNRKGQIRNALSEFGNGIFYGVTSFAKGEVTKESPDEPSVSEKIIIAGFMLFALIVLTAYTASSAAALVGTEVQLQAIQDVINAPNSYLCIEEAIYNVFVSLHPEAQSILRPQVNIDGILESMGKLECAAAIMKQDAIDNSHARDDHSCNIVRVGDVVLSMGNAYPVNLRYADALRYIVGREVNGGRYEPLRSEMKDQHVGPNQCGFDDDSNSGDNDEFLKLGTAELFAPLVLTFGCTTIGLLVFFFPKFLSQVKIRGAEEEGDNVSINKKKHASPEVIGEHKDGNLMLDQISQLKLSELLARLKRCPAIDSSELAEAAEALPERGMLEGLLLRYAYSQATDAREMMIFDKVDAYVLVDAMTKFNNSASRAKNTDTDDEIESIVEASSTSKILKENIIHHIMARPMMKARLLCKFKLSEADEVTRRASNHRSQERNDSLLSASITESSITETSSITTQSILTLLNIDPLRNSDSRLIMPHRQHQQKRRFSSHGVSLSNSVFLGGVNCVFMAQRIINVFCKEHPHSVKSVTSGYMLPNSKQNGDDCIHETNEQQGTHIEVVKVLLNNPINDIQELVTFFLTDSMIVSLFSKYVAPKGGDERTAFILTNDRKNAKVATEAIRKQPASVQAIAFVGRAGAFIEDINMNPTYVAHAHQRRKSYDDSIPIGTNSSSVEGYDISA